LIIEVYRTFAAGPTFLPDYIALLTYRPYYSKHHVICPAGPIKCTVHPALFTL